MAWQSRAERQAQREALLGAMHPVVAKLHTEISALRGWPMADIPPDELCRELIVTPFDGCYGQAGAVVTLNGSPPRFVAVVLGYGVQAVVHVLAPARPRLRPITESGPTARLPLRRAVLAYVKLWQEGTAGQLLEEAEAVVRDAWKKASSA